MGAGAAERCWTGYFERKWLREGGAYAGYLAVDAEPTREPRSFRDRLGGYAFQTQVQERMITRVAEEHGRLAETVSDLSHEVALVIERFDNRLGTIQADLARQRSRMTEITVAVSLGAIGVIIGLAISLCPRLV